MTVWCKMLNASHYSLRIIWEYCVRGDIRLQRIKSWNRYSRIYPHLHNQLQEVVAALLGPTNTQRTRQQLGNFPLFPKLSTQFLGFCCCCVPKTSADPIPEKKKIISQLSSVVPTPENVSYPRKTTLPQKKYPISTALCSIYPRKKKVLSQLSSAIPIPEKILYSRCLVQLLAQKKKNSQKKNPIPTLCSSYPRKKYALLFPPLPRFIFN